jgi:hypothetical protein
MRERDTGDKPADAVVIPNPATLEVGELIITLPDFGQKLTEEWFTGAERAACGGHAPSFLLSRIVAHSRCAKGHLAGSMAEERLE